jgi:hypothetical protein
MTRLTDHDLFQLAAPLRQVEPVTRPAGVPHDASEANAGWTRRFFIGLVAATAVAAVLFVLALAAHSRSSAPQPAKRTFPAPPACAVAAGGSGVDCGPASAAIRTAGSWQVIDQGSCVDHTRLYFGAHTTGGDAPLSLMLNVPPRALAKGGDVRVTDGQLALVSGRKEPLSGQAVVAPGGNSGAYTVHGQNAEGKLDGNAYTGAWTCRAGHTSQQVKQQTRRARLLPRCARNERGFHVHHGYRLVCGPGSAIIWVGGRWQVVSPGICEHRGPLHFGVVDGAYPDGADPHRALVFPLGPFFTDASARSRFLSGGAVAVSDGEIDLPGAHTALSGSMIVQRGGTGGAFDLNNRGGAGVGWPRADYVGAWACGGPPS